MQYPNLLIISRMLSTTSITKVLINIKASMVKYLRTMEHINRDQLINSILFDNLLLKNLVRRIVEFVL
jgi:hypothetical protein